MQVMLMPRDLGTRLGTTLSMDKWDGYPAVRARLLEGVAARGVRNLTTLSGDLHNARAGTLADAEGARLATELCATSISPGGDGSQVLHGTARMLGRTTRISPSSTTTAAYCLHEVTPARMTVAFRALDSVIRCDAPLAEKARFVVESGRVALLRP